MSDKPEKLPPPRSSAIRPISPNIFDKIKSLQEQQALIGTPQSPFLLQKENRKNEKGEMSDKEGGGAAGGSDGDNNGATGAGGSGDGNTGDSHKQGTTGGGSGEGAGGAGGGSGGYGGRRGDHAAKLKDYDSDSVTTEGNVTLEFLKTHSELKYNSYRKLSAQVRGMLDPPVNVPKVKSTFQVLQSAYNAYSTAASKLQLELLTNNMSDELQEEEDKLLLVMSDKSELEVLVKNVTESTSESVHDAPSGDLYKLKLPKRELYQFSGDLREYLDFRATFDEIHKDPKVPIIEKFHYLQCSMVKNSEADKVVKSFPISEANYPLALRALEERFGRKETLVKVYVRDLLHLVVENSKEKSGLNFTDLVTKINSQVRSLEELGITPTSYGDLLYPVVESAIPSYILEQYMRTQGFREELPPLLEFLKAEVQRKLQAKLARESFGERKAKDHRKDGDKKGRREAALVNNVTTNVCLVCDKDNHTTDRCRKLYRMTVQQRKELIKGASVCYVCLKGRHLARDCRSSRKCKQCQGAHHELLCNSEGNSTASAPTVAGGSRAPSRQPSPPPRRNGTSSVDMSNVGGRPEVLLQTILVHMIKPDGNRIKVRALFDSGSSYSYVLKETAKEAGMKPLRHERVTHLTFGGREEVITHPIYRVYIEGLRQHQSYNFEVAGIEQIAGQIDSVKSGPWLRECANMGIHVSDVASDKYPIGLLIGADVGGKLKLGGESLQLESGPVAQRTKLGWVLEGKVRNGSGATATATTATPTCPSLFSITKATTALWDLESLGIVDDPSSKGGEDETEDNFRKTLGKTEEGRYVVSLPWAPDHAPLADNRAGALRRMHTLITSLQKQGMYEKYGEVFSKWEDEKIIERVPAGPPRGILHYLPHRAVFKEHSTTPIRPVFDASAHEKGSPSLNQCLRNGPNLLELVPAILTRFRLKAVGVVADIEKAFLQLELRESDRDSLRFFWKEAEKLVEYRHRRVVFGVKPSPFMLMGALYHLLENSTADEELRKQLKNSLYMDNLVSCVGSRSEAKQLQQKATQLMSEGKFNLRGWEFGPDPNNDNSLSVLGLSWSLKDDTLAVAEVKVEATGPVTKRKLLAVANSIYDPLGILAPYTLQWKLLLREVWEGHYSWDQELSEEFLKKYERLMNQLSQITSVRIQRYVTENKNLRCLHIFCDASGQAYGACAYLRVGDDHPTIQLLLAKTRVAPLKQKVTIPRLELLACLIGARVAETLKGYLETPDIPITFWTDSMTALAWIQRDQVWGTFIRNRTKEIREKTDPKAWRHIPGVDNPADILSRGGSPERLHSIRWHEGPRWLLQPEDKWPTSGAEVDEDVVRQERSKGTVTYVSVSFPCFLDKLDRYGDYHTAMRVVAYVLRFINRARGGGTREGHHPVPAELRTEEIEKAELCVIKHIQKQMEESSLKVRHITRDGVLCVATRLLPDDPSYRERPILPGRHPVIQMLIRKEHLMANHAGSQYLLNILRERFWILKGRKSIRKVIRECGVCRRYSANRCEVEEAPLPLMRTKMSYAFATTGVDLAGPFVVNYKDKIWVAIFTCSVYRAVHFEIVDSLSTQSFIETLAKFIARRGRPLIIVSDNGRNFRGASKFFEKLSWEKVLRFAAVHRIRWHFIVPAAPWWNGFCERIVGLLKDLLKRVMGTRRLRRNQFEVFLYEAESIINDRPLTYMTEDEGDLKALTPAMFLRDIPTSGLPEMGLVQRTRKLLQMKEQFRKRFQKEYLTELIRKTKLNKSIKLIPGDVVLVGEPRPRSEWPIGVVMETLPGVDQVHRTIRLKTKMGEIFRPIQKCFLLEAGQEEVISTPNIGDPEEAAATSDNNWKLHGRTANDPSGETKLPEEEDQSEGMGPLAEDIVGTHDVGAQVK